MCCTKEKANAPKHLPQWIEISIEAHERELKVLAEKEKEIQEKRGMLNERLRSLREELARNTPIPATAKNAIKLMREGYELLEVRYGRGVYKYRLQATGDTIQTVKLNALVFKGMKERKLIERSHTRNSSCEVWKLTAWGCMVEL